MRAENVRVRNRESGRVVNIVEEDEDVDEEDGKPFLGSSNAAGVEDSGWVSAIT